MKCIIKAANRSEAEHQIQNVVKRHGFDWTEVEAVLPDGQIVRWIPMAEAQRRIAAGFKDIYAHFYGAA